MSEESWEAMEAEADEDIAAGRVETFESTEDPLGWLRSPGGVLELEDHRELLGALASSHTAALPAAVEAIVRRHRATAIQIYLKQSQPHVLNETRRRTWDQVHEKFCPLVHSFRGCQAHPNPYSEDT